MNRQTILKRIENLENGHGPDRLVIVPSWGEYVYIDGKPILKAEYQGNPNAKMITLTWGEISDNAPKNPGKTDK